MSHDFTRPARPRLARARGGVVYANDELFAARENLVTPGPPVHDPARVRTTRQDVRRLGDPTPARRPATTWRSCGSACGAR